MRVIDTKLKDVKIIETKVFGDHRGFFTESYSKETFNEADIMHEFIQDNHSLSVEPGVLRGMHFQTPDKGQTKLIRATTGIIYDGFVTLTPNCNVQYKVDEYYSPEHDGGIAFDDPAIGIEWPMPIEKMILSDKDTKHPTLSELDNPFIYGEI